MINEVRMVRVQSTDSGYVNLYAPEYNINKIFKTKGSVQLIPFEALENMLWNEGIRFMFESGTLYIDNMQDKIDLGLEEPDTTEPTNIKVLNDAQIKALLTTITYDTFVKEINSVSVQQANNVVDYAVANEIMDMKKSDYLKQITGRDIVAILAKKRQEAEADRIAAEKERAAKAAEGEFRRV